MVHGEMRYVEAGNNRCLRRRFRRDVVLRAAAAKNNHGRNPANEKSRRHHFLFHKRVHSTAEIVSSHAQSLICLLRLMSSKQASPRQPLGPRNSFTPLTSTSLFARLLNQGYEHRWGSSGTG